jgi:hypothetical protein
VYVRLIEGDLDAAFVERGLDSLGDVEAHGSIIVGLDPCAGREDDRCLFVGLFARADS